MKSILFALLLLSSCGTTAQKVINKEIPALGKISLAPGIDIPRVNSGYTLWLPETGQPAGLVVFTHARRDTVGQDELIRYALSKQLAVLYATTDNRLEFLFDFAKLQEIENYIQEVIVNHTIPKGNMLYCGMSLEGTRALRLAAFSQRPQSKYQLQPKAIAICDAPLDMLRFHKEMVKAKELNFNPIAANEGSWVSAYLESQLGGPPEKKRDAYIDYSPYCYAADGGPNLPYFQNMAIRAYTEPDVNWWMTTRRKDFYGMNALDLAALVNELTIRGNSHAELIITDDRGYRPDGSRHPHSWSIVDEVELIDWFVNLP